MRRIGIDIKDNGVRQYYTRLSTCNEELDQILFSEPKKILIYGEAATGKTNLLLNIVRCSLDSLKPPEALFYISTEGSVFIERVLKLRLVKEGIFFSVALDQQHLIALVLDIIKNLNVFKPIAIVIDSINNYYRIESLSTTGIATFIELLALLDMLSKNGVYILSSAQVRFGEQEVPGYEYLYQWADIILKLVREYTFYRTLKFHKPAIDKVLHFDITLNGVRWLKRVRY